MTIENQLKGPTVNLSLQLFVLCLTSSLVAAEVGPLVIVGGGGTPDDVLREFVQIGGGAKAIVAILPQASSRTNRGLDSVEMFTKLQVASAYRVELDDPKNARELINKATAVWFPGGQQGRLYDALNEAGLIEFLQTRHRAGILFGGTSAGAAIMSEVMIPGAPDKPGLVIGNTPIRKGLGLASDLIIDQHFIARGRINRLLGAVLDHQDRVGVGVGESTAIVVRGGTFIVMGKGSVVVIDGRQASLSQGKLGSLQSGTDMALHVLKAGQSFRFK
jgi:cyanophycinase